jgi:hypothetical protein
MMLQTPPTPTPPVVEGVKDALQSMSDYMSTLTSRATDFVSTFSQLEKLGSEFTKTLGGSRDRIITMESSIISAADSILKMSDNLMTFDQALEEGKGILQDISDATKTAYIGTEQNIKEIFEATKATGVESAILTKTFKDQGFALQSIPKEMQKVADYTRSVGMNVGVVSKEVVANLGKLNLYNFNSGVEGLTKMVAKAQLLNVPMEKVFRLAEDTFDPEKAVNLAASLQRLGVATGDLLDPLRLMDLGQNNPEELTNQIVEMSKRFTYFNEQNQKFEILPGAKRELREIAETIGMNAEELAGMALQSSTLSDKMSKIRFPDLKTGPLTKEQEMLIANLSELRDGDYKIKLEETRLGEGGTLERTGRQIEKSVTELTEADIKMLGEAAKPKSLEEMAKEQVSSGIRTANAAEAILSQIKSGIVGTNIGLSLRRETRKAEITGVEQISKELKFDDILKNAIEESGPKMFDKLSDIFSGKVQLKTEEDFKKVFGDTKLEDIGGDIIKKLFEKGGNIIDILKTTADDFMKGIKPSITPAGVSKTKEEKISESVSTTGDVNSYFSGIERARALKFKLNEDENRTTNVGANTELNQPTTQKVSNVVNTPTSNNTIQSAMSNMSGEIKHQFNDLNIIVKIDAPTGVDTTQITDVVVKTLNRPEIVQSIMAKQTLMTQNYGTTGGKVGTSQSTA